jgi:uncharacterized protein
LLGGSRGQGFQSIAVALFRFGQRERSAAQWIALSAPSYRYRVDMASRDLIEQAGKALVDAVGVDSKVILFGSHARGEERPDSDVDFLVIEPKLADRFGESVRLSRLVGELGVPADVVVVSEDQAREWGAVRGTMLHDALTEGQPVGG